MVTVIYPAAFKQQYIWLPISWFRLHALFIMLLFKVCVCVCVYRSCGFSEVISIIHCNWGTKIWNKITFRLRPWIKNNKFHCKYEPVMVTELHSLRLLHRTLAIPHHHNRCCTTMVLHHPQVAPSVIWGNGSYNNAWKKRF